MDKGATTNGGNGLARPHLTAVLDALGDAIHVIDAEYRIHFCNESCLRLIRQVGYDGDPTGKALGEVFPFLSEKVFEEYRRVFAGEGTLTTEETTEAAGRQYVTETRKIPLRQKGATTRIITVMRDVTAARCAEAELRESERRYRELFSNIPVGICWVTLTGQIFEANEIFARVFGYPDVASVKGIHSAQLYGQPQERPLLRERILQNEEPLTLEVELARADGSRFWGRVDAHAVRDESGRPRHIEASVTDISAQKRAEDELSHRLELEAMLTRISTRFVGVQGDLDRIIEESLAEMGQFVGADRSHLFTLDKEHTILTYAYEWCAAGVEPQKDIVVATPVTDAPWWMERLYRHEVINLPDLEAMPPEAWREHQFLAPQGIKALLVVPVYAGASLLGFIGFDNVREPAPWPDEDITLLKVVAQIVGSALDYRRAAEALRQRELQYRTIFDTATDGLLLVDLETERIVEANPAACAMYDLPHDDMIGTAPLRLVHPDDIDGHHEHLAQVKRAGAAEDTGIGLRRDGAPIRVEVRSRKIDIGGRPNMLSIERDITALRAAEEQAALHQSQLAHAARLSTLGEMASSLAHEINQPLCAIAANAAACRRLADMHNKDPEDLRGAIEQISRQADRATQIVKRIRGFSRKQAPVRSAVNLEDVIRESMALVEPEARRAQVAIHTRKAADVPSVPADALQIEQVVINLLRNAIEAMEETPANKRRITITTSRPDAGRVRVSVSDRGAMALPDPPDKVFEPFFTTKPDGLGIGLSISRNIVEKHGGAMIARGNSAGGATFSFTLPLRPEPSG